MSKSLNEVALCIYEYCLTKKIIRKPLGKKSNL